jgi:uncharacterized protein YndB with AHSA1/START domain
MQDRIEKRIELKAPVSRVWRAITDHREFGEWFGVTLEGPFAPGRVVSGKMANPKYQHIQMEVTVKEVQPERLFSYTWHPYAVDPDTDYSKETPTLVEFRLEKSATGTLLVVSESGFDKIPAHRRDEAFRMDEGGWTSQIKNIERYVERNVPQNA